MSNEGYPRKEPVCIKVFGLNDARVEVSNALHTKKELNHLNVSGLNDAHMEVSNDLHTKKEVNHLNVYDINDLPLEIILEIIKNISPTDQLAFISSNKKFRSLARFTCITMQVNYFNYEEIQESHNKPFSLANQIKRIAVKNTGDNIYDTKTFELLRFIKKISPDEIYTNVVGILQLNLNVWFYKDLMSSSKKMSLEIITETDLRYEYNANYLFSWVKQISENNNHECTIIVGKICNFDEKKLFALYTARTNIKVYFKHDLIIYI